MIFRRKVSLFNSWKALAQESKSDCIENALTLHYVRMDIQRERDRPSAVLSRPGLRHHDSPLKSVCPPPPIIVCSVSQWIRKRAKVSKRGALPLKRWDIILFLMLVLISSCRSLFLEQSLLSDWCLSSDFNDAALDQTEHRLFHKVIQPDINKDYVE